MITGSFHNSRVVSHENINRVDYCTISQKGVTRIRSDDETEFETLDRWELEYNYFRKLIKARDNVSNNTGKSVVCYQMKFEKNEMEKI